MIVLIGNEKGKEQIQKFFTFLDSKKYQCKKSISESADNKDKIVIRYISNEGVKVDVFDDTSLEENQFESLYQKLMNAQ